MTQNTGRDAVWSAALWLAYDDHAERARGIYVADVRRHIIDEYGEEPPSDRTIRDTMNSMATHGWLAKLSPQAQRWRLGDAAIDAYHLADVRADARAAERRREARESAREHVFGPRDPSE